MPKKGEMVDIVLYDKKNDKNKIIDSTSSWNWQLGSMLQWLNYKDKIIYNLFDNKKPKTAIYDIFNKTKEIHPYNFIALNNKIDSYLSINFNHLNLSRPGYGYDYENEYNKDFYLIEYNYKKKENIFELDYDFFVSNNNHTNLKNHSLEHFEYSPCGKKISFIERWDLSKNHRFSRLVIMNRENKNYIYTTQCGRVTHYIWLNTDEIMYFGSSKLNLSNKVRSNKPIIFNFLYFFYKLLKLNNQNFIKNNLNGDGFKILNLNDRKIKNIKIGKNFGDGHPTYSKNENTVYIDTYPDSFGKIRLYSYNFFTKKTKIINEFYTDKKNINTGYRTDLHPKINLSEDLIFIDLENSKKRSLAAFKIHN